VNTGSRSDTVILKIQPRIEIKIAERNRRETNQRENTVKNQPTDVCLLASSQLNREVAASHS